MIPEGACVFDVGCGGGVLLLLLAVTRPDVTGIGVDTSEAAIDLARQAVRRCASARNRISFAVCSETSDWPQGTFDVVCLVDVLHHVPPDRQLELLSEAAQRVKPGGMLIYKDIASHPWWKAQANRLHDLFVSHEKVHYVASSTVIAYLKERGFRCRGKECINIWWYSHELMWFERS